MDRQLTPSVFPGRVIAEGVFGKTMILKKYQTKRRNTMPTKSKIHKVPSPSHAKHTVKANHHVKGHSTIHTHKGTGKVKVGGKRRTGKKTILK